MVTAAYNLGVYHEQQGELQKAVELFEEARIGGIAEAAYNLGLLHANQGELQKAMELFEEARIPGFLMRSGADERTQKARSPWESSAVGATYIDGQLGDPGDSTSERHRRGKKQRERLTPTQMCNTCGLALSLAAAILAT